MAEPKLGLGADNAPVNESNADRATTPDRVKAWAMSNRWELVPVAGFTVVAGFLRVYRLADLPPGLHGDEALTGLDALRVVDEGWIGPYVGSALGQPTGPLYWTALLFKLSHPSLFVLRLSMALLGIATVPAAYILFRVGFGRWVAVFGTIALVFSFWHLQFSRVGFMVISMPLVIAAGSLMTLWALRSVGKWPWFLTGLVLGLGVYSYGGYLAFLGTFGAFLAVQLVLLRSRWRALLPRYALLVLGALIVALPMVRFAISESDVYFSHASLISFYRDPAFTESDGAGDKVVHMAGRFWSGLTVLTHHPDVDFTDGTGGRGALNPILAFLAYIGLGIALFRWRRPPYLLAALVVMAGLIVIAFTATNWGDMRRSLVAVPFVYGLAGLGAWELARLGQRLLGARAQQAPLAIAGLALVVAAAWNGYYYFGDYVDEGHTDWVFVGRLVDGLDAAHTFDDPGEIYFYSSRWSYNYETRKFLYPDTPGTDRSREFGEFSLERTGSGPVTYVLLPPYETELTSLEEMYPGGTAVSESNGEGSLRYAVYHVP